MKFLSSVIFCVYFCRLSCSAEFSMKNHYANMSMQYTAIFHGCKNGEKMLYFSYFCSKHRLWVHVRTASLRRF